MIRWQVALSCLLLSIFALVFSMPPTHAPFVLDDMTKLAWNADLRKTNPSVSDFLATYREGESAFRNDPSRPLTYFIYWVCYRAGAGDSFPFHLASVLVHLFNAWLLAAIAYELSASLMAAFAAATLFFYAPLMTESVLYAFAFSDVLAAFFILGAVYMHLRAPKVWLEMPIFILALASKQSAIVLPALLFVVDLLRAKRMWRNYGALILVAVLYLSLRQIFLGGIGDLEARQGTQSPGPYFLAQGLMVWKYLTMLVDYRGFSIDHFLRVGDFDLWLQIAAWIGLVGLSVALYFSRWTTFCLWLAFLIALSPTSSFLPTVDLFTERRAYLPCAFLFLALALYCVKLTRAKIAALILLISLETAASEQRQTVFGSARTLWAESFKLYPQSPRARMNLASAEAADGDYKAAASLYEGLLPQQPTNAILYSKLGFVYAQANNSERDLNKAWKYYERSLELDPNDPIALMNATPLLLSLNKYDEAEKLVRHLLQVSPNMPYAHYVAGLVYARERRMLEARTEFEMAVKLDPGFTEAREALRGL